MDSISFLTDLSTEMIVNLLPLFLANVLGAPGALVGLIEGLAEAVSSLLKIVAGWLSDRLGKRKALSDVLATPFPRWPSPSRAGHIVDGGAGGAGGRALQQGRMACAMPSSGQHRREQARAGSFGFHRC
ncbi:MAG: hypothetical protein R3A10_03650 [Caldilineaceae bacterium]